MLFCGSGATAAVALLMRILHLSDFVKTPLDTNTIPTSLTGCSTSSTGVVCANCDHCIGRMSSEHTARWNSDVAVQDIKTPHASMFMSEVTS